MKRFFPVLAIFMLAAAAAPVFAAPCAPGGMPGFVPGMLRSDAGPYLAAEIQQIAVDMGAQKLGDLEMSGLFSVRDRLSVAAQKDEYVREMGFRSFLLPGLGQLGTGHTGAGIGFMAADLVTLTGTFIAAYYMLPSDLRFDRLDYFHSDFTTINGAWGAHTFTDYLPAALTVLVGMTVDQTLRHWSAAAARRDAAGYIDAGSVTFTPRVGLGVLGFQIAY